MPDTRAAERGDEKREEQDARVEAHHVAPRQRRPGEPHEEAAGPGGAQDPDDQPEAGQHQLLDEHLTREAEPARAQRGADRKLAASAQRTGEDQVGQVGAGDEQHQAHGAHDQPERGAHVLGAARLQGDHVG